MVCRSGEVEGPVGRERRKKELEGEMAPAFLSGQAASPAGGAGTFPAGLRSAAPGPPSILPAHGCQRLSFPLGSILLKVQVGFFCGAACEEGPWRKRNGHQLFFFFFPPPLIPSIYAIIFGGTSGVCSFIWMLLLCKGTAGFHASLPYRDIPFMPLFPKLRQDRRQRRRERQRQFPGSWDEFPATVPLMGSDQKNPPNLPPKYGGISGEVE